MKLEVTGCADCPFCGETWDTPYCVHPVEERSSNDCEGDEAFQNSVDGGGWPPPDWCKLREEPVTVELKKP